MEVSQLMTVGKELGLEGADLQKFIERKEKEALDREERREREAYEREEKKELDKIARAEKVAKEAAEREERAKVREDRLKELELEKENRILENDNKIKLQELENISKLELLDKQIELEKVKAMSKPEPKHEIKGPKLPPFEEGKDDMDAYLHSFERFSKSLGWPQKDWAVRLSSLLKGKALETYTRLSNTEANDFEKVKQALLKRFELTQEGFRQKFRSCRPDDGESAPQFALRLENYLIRWVELAGADKSFQGLKDLLLREQFINAAHRELALFLKERKPDNINLMAELADQFLEAHGSQTMFSKKPYDPCKKPGYLDKQAPKQKPESDAGKSMTGKTGNRKFCYFCNRKGHITDDCWDMLKLKRAQGGKQAAGFISLEDQLTDVKVSEKPNEKSVTEACACSSSDIGERDGCIHDNKVRLECGHELPFISALCGTKQVQSMPVVHGILNGEMVSVLRDTGCSSVVVRRNLVSADQFTGKIQRCVLIDGTVREVPVAKIQVSTPYYTGNADALCMVDPIYDLILGNIHGVRNPDKPDEFWKGKTSNKSSELDSYKVSPNREKADRPDSKAIDDFQKQITELGVDEGKYQEEKESLTDNDTVEIADVNADMGQAVQTRGQKLKESKGFSTLKVLDSIKVKKDEFKNEQVSCDTLNWVRRKAKSSEKRESHGIVSWFKEYNGLIYRYFENKLDTTGHTKKQLVVPKNFRGTILKLAHESILGGHLGMKKTSDKIRLQFFWPGLQQDVKLHCISCDLCQKTFPKGKVTRVPLERMPLIETPFERVAVDIVGPIQPVSDSKNRYILTLMDYATRYPEAVPLPGIEAERVTEALFNMFTRLGFPSEILTDLGSQFTSDVMKEVSRLLSMRMLNTTAYHPMCNGLVEKFNGTLKNMLKKVCADNPRDWDRYVPALLFAYREAPQESLGFSPFELLYGRTVRGPMAILKDLWTDEVKQPEVSTTYQYVLELRQRLEDTLEVARKELEKSASRYKMYYDRKTRPRTFQVGDEVLLLLPTEESKLLMQWQGPYKVVDKIGRCDYRIEVKGKVKPFHANLLKKYVSRVEAGAVTIQAKVSSIFEVEAQGLCEMAFAGIIDSSIDEDAEIGEGSSVNDDELLEVPDFKGNECIEDVKVNPELSEKQKKEIREILNEFQD